MPASSCTQVVWGNQQKLKLHYWGERGEEKEREEAGERWDLESLGNPGTRAGSRGDAPASPHTPPVKRPHEPLRGLRPWWPPHSVNSAPFTRPRVQLTNPAVARASQPGSKQLALLLCRLVAELLPPLPQQPRSAAQLSKPLDDWKGKRP